MALGYRPHLHTTQLLKEQAGYKSSWYTDRRAIISLVRGFLCYKASGLNGPWIPRIEDHPGRRIDSLQYPSSSTSGSKLPPLLSFSMMYSLNTALFFYIARAMLLATSKSSPLHKLQGWFLPATQLVSASFISSTRAPADIIAESKNMACRYNDCYILVRTLTILPTHPRKWHVFIFRTGPILPVQ